jgi:hypothetical protein
MRPPAALVGVYRRLSSRLLQVYNRGTFDVSFTPGVRLGVYTVRMLDPMIHCGLQSVFERSQPCRLDP